MGTGILHTEASRRGARAIAAYDFAQSESFDHSGLHFLQSRGSGVMVLSENASGPDYIAGFAPVQLSLIERLAFLPTPCNCRPTKNDTRGIV